MSLVSGVILVSCDGKSCKDVIRKSRTEISGITSAFIVDKKTSDDTGVVINLDTVSEDDFMKAAKTILEIGGVQKVNYKIT